MFESNLTAELARMGIPNPFAELTLTRADNMRLFGRAYVGWMKVSDIVTVPEGADLYDRCAVGDQDTSLAFDATGEISQRPAPPEGFTYAIVQSPTWSKFWHRLETAVDLRAEGGNFMAGDTFVATYGIPTGAVEIPSTELPVQE